MPVTPNIRPFIIDTVIDHLKSIFGDTFKTYFFGDPITVGAEQMPCVIVSKTSGEIGFGPTGMDENAEEILIQVILNKKDELGNPALEHTSHRRLMELIEGRDAATNQYLDNSLIGVLRKNATLGNVIINQVARPEYAVNMRDEDTFTEEGSIRLSVEELIPVSNRS